MLILTRARGTEVVIRPSGGPRITVTVLEVGEGRVKLGFSAPDTTTIYRGELLERIEAGERAKRPEV